MYKDPPRKCLKAKNTPPFVSPGVFHFSLWTKTFQAPSTRQAFARGRSPGGLPRECAQRSGRDGESGADVARREGEFVASGGVSRLGLPGTLIIRQLNHYIYQDNDMYTVYKYLFYYT